MILYSQEELEKLITALTICQRGFCSQCDYKEKCMDGLIDDSLDFLNRLNEERLHRILESRDEYYD